MGNFNGQGDPAYVSQDEGSMWSGPLTQQALANQAQQAQSGVSEDNMSREPAPVPALAPEQPLQQLAQPAVEMPQAPQGPSSLTTTEYQKQSGVKGLIDPNNKQTVESMLTTAHAQEKDALKRMNDFESESFFQEAQSIDDMRQLSESAHADMTARIQRQQERQQALFNQIDADRKRAEEQIDPNRVWNSMSTGRKALSMFLIALGGGTGAIGGGKGNSALEALDQAVQRDIDAQKTNITNARGAAETGMNQYQQLRQAGLDDREATSMLSKMQREQIDLRLKSMLARTKSESVKAGLDQAIAQNQLKLAADITNLRQLAADKVTFGSRTQPLVADGEAASKNMKTQLELEDHYRKLLSDPNSPGGRYQKAKDMHQKLKSGITAETDGVLMGNFVALGMQPGAFGPAFVEFVDDSSTPRQVWEKIRSTFMGGKNKELIARMNKYSREVLQYAANEVGTLARQARSRGVDPEIYLGSTYDKDPEELGSVGKNKIKD